MQFSYLVTFTHPDARARVSNDDRERVAGCVEATPGLSRARLYTPAAAQDYYTNDGPSPTFAFQLDFERLVDLETAIGPDGHLQALARGSFAILADCAVEQQVMARRPFPAVDPTPAVPDGALPCQFLVHYPGHAEDFDAWLNYYLSHHPQIMKFFEGVREIEIFTRVDWVDAMPWKRVHYMQRNKLMFDSAEAITRAMNSPVRHQMRADFERFPPFVGSNIHHPMWAETRVGSVRAVGMNI
ncbi:hypothetical protein LMG28614_06375 [Paraburkholderia ultramafica]|uniref:EthD domain-containing protein n=1 Tax=Paraburkholderia ultramafica TaxID=1544867 RepID=A0A6S7DH34_9BURK|nr:hypothetical protein [Paraburkholderia ultramafica]CAB3806349.1 hypothetical protein LMG28614_06375 [Paraburkholderia ultramafica]